MNYSSTLTFTSQYDPDVSFVVRKPSHGRRIEFDLAAADYRTKIRDVQRKHKTVSEEIDELRSIWRTEMDAKLVTLRTLDTEEAKAEIAGIELGRELEKLRWLYGQAETDELKSEVLTKLAAIDPKVATQFEIPRELDDQIVELNREALRLLAKHYNPQRIRWGLRSVEGLAIDDAPATVETLIADGPEDLLREILSRIEEVAGLTGEALKLSFSPIGSNEPVTGSLTATTATSAVSPSSTEAATA